MMISHSVLYILDKFHHLQTCKNHKILQDSITQLSAKKASLSMLLPLRTVTLCRVWFGDENFRRKTHRSQRHLCLGPSSRFMREGGRLGGQCYDMVTDGAQERGCLSSAGQHDTTILLFSRPNLCFYYLITSPILLPG